MLFRVQLRVMGFERYGMLPFFFLVYHQYQALYCAQGDGSGTALVGCGCWQAAEMCFQEGAEGKYFGS